MRTKQRKFKAQLVVATKKLTGRVAARAPQLPYGSMTGRMTSSTPNLRGIPRR